MFIKTTVFLNESSHENPTFLKSWLMLMWESGADGHEQLWAHFCVRS